MSTITLTRCSSTPRADTRVNADGSLTQVAGGLHVALALTLDPHGDVYVVDNIPGVVMRLDGTTTPLPSRSGPPCSARRRPG